MDNRTPLKKSLDELVTALKNLQIQTFGKPNTHSKIPEYCEVGSLFAQGFIYVKDHLYWYQDMSFESISALARYLDQHVLQDKVGSSQQYVSRFLSEADLRGYHKSEYVYKNIYNYCITHNISPTVEFMGVYNKD